METMSAKSYREQLDSRILDCGHSPSPHGEYTTGTAWYGDTEICCGCADIRQIESLKTDKRIMAYISNDGKSVTTWTGGKLMTINYMWNRRVGYGGVRWYINAVDVHGQHWHGNSPERNGMYCRMTKSMTKSWLTPRTRGTYRCTCFACHHPFEYSLYS